MEQPFSSINALVQTLSRLAQSCIFKWLGYTFFPVKSLLIITKYLKGDGKTLPLKPCALGEISLGNLFNFYALIFALLSLC